MKNKIYIKQWLELKPYKNPTVTDSYYLKLSNEIKNSFFYPETMLLSRFLNPEELDLLACFLASWFEDVISGIGVWKTFLDLHKQHYGKVLPFFDTEDYIEDEINEEDVAFLTWYFLNSVQEENFVSPFNQFISDTAFAVMEILEEKCEYAPENNYLKRFYRLDKNETDFYSARNLIDTLLFKTWLFFPDTLRELRLKEAEIIENTANDENLMSYLNDNRDSYLHTAHTRLMSIKGKDWVAKIVGDSHPLSSAFSSMSQRVQGYFLYKGQNNEVIFLEHIASGKKFEMTKKSFDHSAKLVKPDTIVLIGLVNWINEWWFSGVYLQNEYNAGLVSDEKKSAQSRAQVNFLDHEKYDAKKDLQKQMQAFIKFNNGSQVAFMPKGEIESFIQAFLDFFNNSLAKTSKEKEEALERMRKQGLQENSFAEVNLEEKAETALVFFNPNSGAEIGFGLNNAFPLPHNPYFDENNSNEDVMHLLVSEELSTELVMYCVENCREKLPFFNQFPGKHYLEDIDFLLRFWKRGGYHSKPQITYTDGD
jgi:hypothetical protein